MNSVRLLSSILFLSCIHSILSGQTLTERWRGSTLAENWALAVATAGAHTYVVNASFTENTIQTWRLEATGALTPAMTTPLATGNGPQAAVATPDGAWVVLANQMDSTLQVYALEESTGQLSAHGDPVSSAGPQPQAMAMSSNGTFVAVANQDNVAVFHLESATGNLSLCDSTTLGGFGPLSVDISDSGILATGHEDGTVAIHQMELITGEVSLLHSNPTGGTVGSVALNATGDNLIAGSFEFSVDGATVTQYAVDLLTGGISVIARQTNLGDPFSTPKVALSDDEQTVLVATTFGSPAFRVYEAFGLDWLTDFIPPPRPPSEFVVNGLPSGGWAMNEPFTGATTIFAYDPTPAPQKPAAPELTGSALGPNQIDLAWTDNADNEDSYSVERSFDAVNFDEIATLPADSTSFLHSGLLAETNYFYRIRASNAVGDSLSNIVLVTTLNAPPASPSDLTGSAAGPHQIDLAWTDNAPNEDGFNLYRRESGGSFAYLVSLPVNVETYSDTTVEDGKTYEYQVTGENEEGESAPSNVVSVTTPEIPRPPDDPSDLTATVTGPAQITLNWTDVPDNETEYVVLRREAGDRFFDEIATLPADSTHYIDIAAEPAIEYNYRVDARNALGRGETNIAVATTPVATLEVRFSELTTTDAGELGVLGAPPETDFLLGSDDGGEAFGLDIDEDQLFSRNIVVGDIDPLETFASGTNGNVRDRIVVANSPEGELDVFEYNIATAGINPIGEPVTTGGTNPTAIDLYQIRVRSESWFPSEDANHRSPLIATGHASGHLSLHTDNGDGLDLLETITVGTDPLVSVAVVGYYGRTFGSDIYYVAVGDDQGKISLYRVDRDEAAGTVEVSALESLMLPAGLLPEDLAISHEQVWRWALVDKLHLTISTRDEGGAGNVLFYQYDSGSRQWEAINEVFDLSTPFDAPAIEFAADGTILFGATVDTSGNQTLFGWGLAGQPVVQIPLGTGATEFSLGVAPGAIDGFTTIAVHASANGRTHIVEFHDGLTRFDYGDASDGAAEPNYPTTLDHDGARHLFTGAGPYLGKRIDGDPGDQHDTSATADDIDGFDDEDGIVFDQFLIPGETSQVTVTASQPAKLDGWIDYNQDGDWADAGEKAFDTVDVGAGETSFSFMVPAGAPLGTTFARFRLSTAGGLEVTGLANDGEVEDYQVPIGAVGPPVLLGSIQRHRVVLNLPFGGDLECSPDLGASWTAVPLIARPGTFVIFPRKQPSFCRFLLEGEGE